MFGLQRRTTTKPDEINYPDDTEALDMLKAAYDDTKAELDVARANADASYQTAENLCDMVAERRRQRAEENNNEGRVRFI